MRSPVLPEESEKQICSRFYGVLRRMLTLGTGVCELKHATAKRALQYQVCARAILFETESGQLSTHCPQGL